MEPNTYNRYCTECEEVTVENGTYNQGYDGTCSDCGKEYEDED